MEHVDKRLTAVNSVQIMCRVTLSACLLLSVLILLSQFNAYFSWYRSFAAEDFEVDLSGKARKMPVPHLRKEVVNQWLDSRSFKLPFVDIPILPSDIAILGGLSICVSTVFFMFYARREHFAISHLLHDAKRAADNRVKEAVLHSVLSGFVFVTFTSRTEPHEVLDDVPNMPEAKSGLRWPSYCLILFPALAVLLSMAADIYSYVCIDSPFRGYPPVKDWKTNGVSFVVRNLISLGFLAWATHHCYTVVRFQRATGALVAQYIEACTPNDA